MLYFCMTEQIKDVPVRGRRGASAPIFVTPLPRRTSSGLLREISESSNSPSMTPKSRQSMREDDDSVSSSQVSSSSSAAWRPRQLRDELLKQMRDPLVVAVFRRFLLKQHSEENLDFYLEVERLHHTPNDGLSTKCYSIYNTYVKPESKSQVNLTSPALKEVDGRMDQQEYTTKLFDRCQNEALNLLRVNFWAEFRQSTDFLAASRGDFTLLDENGPEKKSVGPKSTPDPTAAATPTAPATSAPRTSAPPQPSAQPSSQSTPVKTKNQFKFSALFSKSKSTQGLQTPKAKMEKVKTKR